MEPSDSNEQHEAPSSPSWDALFATASGQEGMFTAQQAAQAGYSLQLLAHHVRRGRMIRLGRGLYRLVHFPAGEHEELVAVWLWSERTGVVSHQTALALHELSDILPSRIHVTLPSAWRRRRLRVPPGVVLHHADVPAADRGWLGSVPITNPRRSLNDCAHSNLSPELLRPAALQAVRRGLVGASELREVDQALAPFGGLAA
jgi:predicted transcriptional regulator of viral defense system